MTRRKVAKSTPRKYTRKCATTRRRTCAKTKREKTKKESKLKKFGKFALGAGALAGAGALGYYAHKNKDLIDATLHKAKNQAIDMFNDAKYRASKYLDSKKSAAEEYWGEANSRGSDIYNIGKLEVADLYKRGRNKIGAFGGGIKNATADYMQKAGNWIGDNKVGNYLTNTAGKIPRYNKPVYEDTWTLNSLNDFKDNLKTSNYIDPMALDAIVVNYKDDIEARDPFKMNEVNPLIKDAMGYVNKAKNAYDKGETYWTEGYKRGLDKVLDSLITKYNAITH